MSRSIVPVNIRPHLVPFLYQEFEGIEAHYLNKKVKAVKISTRANFGKIIRLLCEKSHKPLKADKFNVFLSVQNREKNSFFGSVYKCKDGTHSFLRLPEEGVKLLNDHLEDMFRLSFIAFVTGYITKNERSDVTKAIHIFIETYNLHEYGYSFMSLHRNYNRYLEDNALLVRFQKAVSNRVLNYR